MFALAGHLKKHVHEIESLPATEFIRWIAYSRIQPIGAHRDDIRTAYAAAVAYNVTRPRKARPLKPRDFMPQYERKRIQTGAEIAATMNMMAAAQNESIKHGNDNRKT